MLLEWHGFKIWNLRPMKYNQEWVSKLSNSFQTSSLLTVGEALGAVSLSQPHFSKMSIKCNRAPPLHINLLADQRHNKRLFQKSKKMRHLNSSSIVKWWRSLKLTCRTLRVSISMIKLSRFILLGRLHNLWKHRRPSKLRRRILRLSCWWKNT